MSSEITKPTKPTKTRQAFLDWYKAKQENGFEIGGLTPGNVSQATVDDVLQCIMDAVTAYEEGRYTDLSNM